MDETAKEKRKASGALKPLELLLKSPIWEGTINWNLGRLFMKVYFMIKLMIN